MLPTRLNNIFCRYFGFQHLSSEEIEYRALALTIIVLIAMLDFTYNLAFYLFGGRFPAKHVGEIEMYFVHERFFEV